jgi:hypothetical protein
MGARSFLATYFGDMFITVDKKKFIVQSMQSKPVDLVDKRAVDVVYI